jgi:hypothetical protein
MSSDLRPQAGSPVPASPNEWDEIFRQLEEEIARAQAARAAGRPLGPLPLGIVDGHASE